MDADCQPTALLKHVQNKPHLLLTWELQGTALFLWFHCCFWLPDWSSRESLFPLAHLCPPDQPSRARTQDGSWYRCCSSGSPYLLLKLQTDYAKSWLGSFDKLLQQTFIKHVLYCSKYWGYSHDANRLMGILCNFHWLPNIPRIFGLAFEVIAEASPMCLSALIHVPP